jgi:peptidyl-prolyl cis-trans isomerase A (cyclophilin A)
MDSGLEGLFRWFLVTEEALGSMKRITVVVVALIAVALVTAAAIGCGGEQEADTQQQATAQKEKAAEQAATSQQEAEVKSKEADTASKEIPPPPEKEPPTPPKEASTFKAKFETTKGDFVIQVERRWAPKGADRFYNLVNNGFYDNCRFFRVLDGFMAQFGINGDPKISTAWRGAKIRDDVVKKSNTRGFVTYAMGGPNTRTSQIFVNYGNNARLDTQGFSPFGEVIEGMDVVENFYSGYGEGAPSGKGPSQGQLQSEGNAYLEKDFPKLDYIKKATVVE